MLTYHAPSIFSCICHVCLLGMQWHSTPTVLRADGGGLQVILPPNTRLSWCKSPCRLWSLPTDEHLCQDRRVKLPLLPYNKCMRRQSQATDRTFTSLSTRGIITCVETTFARNYAKTMRIGV